MQAAFITIPLVLLLVFFFLYTGKQKKHFHFRKARPDELGVLKELGLLSYSQHKDVLGTEWETMKKNLSSDSFWTQLLQTSTPFVCEDYNKIVGMAFLVPSGHPNDIYEAGWSYIRMVGVDPEYGGKGIARRLTQLCIEEARHTNETVITLHTSEFMNAARHIYESLGFKKVKELPMRFGKRYWLYRLDL